MRAAFAFLLLISFSTKAQVRVSMGTDVSLLRNFSTNQQFFAFGQSIQGNVHVTPKQTAYAWLSYYLQSSFTNSFTATAKNPATTPATAPFRIRGSWKYNHISIGLKQYFYGSFDTQEQLSIYGLAGFGLLFANATNTQLDAIDTAQYVMPASPVIGSSSFKRLTLDLGIGAEYPLGANFYAYADLRTWIATSNYPAAIYHTPNKAPLPVLLSAGLRVLFGE